MSAAKHILLVDDSPVIQATASLALKRAGYQVTVRGAFDELLEHGTEGFDLILMDVQMPELYGDDVAFTLRNERLVKTPIYLFSSMEEAELANLAADAGVEGYISKSAGLEELIMRVRQIFAR